MNIGESDLPAGLRAFLDLTDQLVGPATLDLGLPEKPLPKSSLRLRQQRHTIPRL
jgi:hypothetical protein